jgi:hypothetical protein
MIGKLAFIGSMDIACRNACHRLRNVLNFGYLVEPVH